MATRFPITLSHRRPMTDNEYLPTRRLVRNPLATPQELAGEPDAFPAMTAEESIETGYPDWQRRLTSNLSRRMDGRWEPLTRTHAPEVTDEPLT
jgi:hypothetical protein